MFRLTVICLCIASSTASEDLSDLSTVQGSSALFADQSLFIANDNDRSQQFANVVADESSVFPVTGHKPQEVNPTLVPSLSKGYLPPPGGSTSSAGHSFPLTDGLNSQNVLHSKIQEDRRDLIGQNAFGNRQPQLFINRFIRPGTDSGDIPSNQFGTLNNRRNRHFNGHNQNTAVDGLFGRDRFGDRFSNSFTHSHNGGFAGQDGINNNGFNNRGQNKLGGSFNENHDRRFNHNIGDKFNDNRGDRFSDNRGGSFNNNRGDSFNVNRGDGFNNNIEGDRFNNNNDDRFDVFGNRIINRGNDRFDDGRGNVFSDRKDNRFIDRKDNYRKHDSFNNTNDRFSGNIDDSFNRRFSGNRGGFINNRFSGNGGDIFNDSFNDRRDSSNNRFTNKKASSYTDEKEDRYIGQAHDSFHRQNDDGFSAGFGTSINEGNDNIFNQGQASTPRDRIATAEGFVQNTDFAHQGIVNQHSAPFGQDGSSFKQGDGRYFANDFAEKDASGSINQDVIHRREQIPINRLADQSHPFNIRDVIMRDGQQDDNFQRHTGTNRHIGGLSIYGVRDRSSGTDYSRQESSDGHTTNGQYSVLMPDGRMQIVTYTANAKDGYNADVRYVGLGGNNSADSNTFDSPLHTNGLHGNHDNLHGNRKIHNGNHNHLHESHSSLHGNSNIHNGNHNHLHESQNSLHGNQNSLQRNHNNLQGNHNNFQTPSHNQHIETRFPPKLSYFNGGKKMPYGYGGQSQLSQRSSDNDHVTLERLQHTV